MPIAVRNILSGCVPLISSKVAVPSGCEACWMAASSGAWSIGNASASCARLWVQSANSAAELRRGVAILVYPCVTFISCTTSMV